MNYILKLTDIYDILYQTHPNKSIQFVPDEGIPDEAIAYELEAMGKYAVTLIMIEFAHTVKIYDVEIDDVTI